MVGANMKGAQRDALAFGHGPRLNSKKKHYQPQKDRTQIGFLKYFSLA